MLARRIILGNHFTKAIQASVTTSILPSAAKALPSAKTRWL